MPMEAEPIVGAVYEDEEGESFEVLAFNEDDGLIDIRYDDGTVDQIDLDAWYDMDLEAVSEEDDWDEDDDVDVDEGDDTDDDLDDDLDDDYESDEKE